MKSSMGIKTWIILFLIVCPSFLDDLPVGWLSSKVDLPNTPTTISLLVNAKAKGAGGSGGGTTGK